MDLKKVEKFIDMAKDKGVKKLKFESDDVKFEVELPYSEAPALMSVAPTLNQAIATEKTEAPKAKSNYIEITSPFVGTYYAASSPDTPPYVKVGDKISSGKVLCIVEAMKIMNEIESEVNGEIVEVCVENENYVEFGQVLFRVKP